MSHGIVTTCCGNPLVGYKKATIYGKGPSLPEEVNLPDDESMANVDIFINHSMAAVSRNFWRVWAAARDYTVVPFLRKQGVDPQYWLLGPMAWGACTPMEQEDAYYFPTTLLRGTAPMVLQICADAGIWDIELIGFDNFWGDPEPKYAAHIEALGIHPLDYQTQFPASGEFPEVRDEIIENMNGIIQKYGLRVTNGSED